MRALLHGAHSRPQAFTAPGRRASRSTYAVGVTPTGSTDEVDTDTPRMWAEFTDPAEPAQRLRVDLTWLTSAYRCIFGQGCPGVYADRPDDGCCTLGAHFTGAEDVARVRDVAISLGPDEWQMHDLGRGDAWVATVPGDPDETTTTTVDGACIFLNRPGFPAGAGCALHQHALATDVPPHTTKPDVCWQLPLQRSYRDVMLADETEYVEITIGEYERAGWGPGGHDFDWYCTASPLAHSADDALYRTAEAELVELMGAPAYEVLVDLCDHVMAERPAPLRTMPGGRAMLPLFVHPATAAAAAQVGTG